MTKKVKRSVAPFYLVAALWLVWALILPLYRPLDYIMAAVASVIVFIVGKAIWPDKAYQIADPEGETKDPEKKERTRVFARDIARQLRESAERAVSGG